MKPFTTEAQRPREKQDLLSFDFLCDSVVK